MRIPVITLLASFCFTSITLEAQHFGQLGGSLRGNMAYRSKVIQDVPGSFQFKNDFTRTYKSYFLSYPVSEKWNLGLEYVRTEGWTGFSLEPEFCSGFCGRATSIIRLNRFSLYGERRLLDIRNIFRVTAYVKVTYESADHTDDTSVFGELEKISSWRPEFTGPYTEWNIFVQPLGGDQILPGAALRFNLKLFWRLYAHFEYGFSVGHRDFQKVFFENTFEGEPGVTGEWATNGTLKYKIYLKEGS